MAITNCYGLCFILSYDGDNPVILRLKMWLMLWGMGLEHRINSFLVAPDYFSRCKEDLCCDPLVREFLNYTTELRKLYPVDTGPMVPSNMPTFRGPHIKAALDKSAGPTFF